MTRPGRAADASARRAGCSMADGRRAATRRCALEAARRPTRTRPAPAHSACSDPVPGRRAADPRTLARLAVAAGDARRDAALTPGSYAAARTYQGPGPR